MTWVPTGCREPIIDVFLDVLEADVRQYPERVRAIPVPLSPMGEAENSLQMLYGTSTMAGRHAIEVRLLPANGRQVMDLWDAGEVPVRFAPLEAG